MAIGRSRYAPPLSTKGHSVLKTRSYGLSSSRTSAPSVVTPRSFSYGSRAEEHMLADRVSNVNYLSNALLDEGYDTALRSRNRDQALLKEATNAIVSSESFATPQTSVAARRVARGESVARRASSVPPRPTPRQEVDRAPISSYYRPIVVTPTPRGQDRATSVPPVVVFREAGLGSRSALPTMTREERRSIMLRRGASVPPAPRTPLAPTTRPYSSYSTYSSPSSLPPRPAVHVGNDREPQLVPPTAGLKAHPRTRRFLTRSGMSLYSSQQGSAGGVGDVSRPLYSLPPRAPRAAPMKESLKNFPQVYVPSYGQRPSNRSKAAIIASKMEPDPVKRRGPRSQYAANKYREIRREKMESPTSVGAASGGSERRRH